MVGVVKMYQKEYERWMAADLEDPGPETGII